MWEPGGTARLFIFGTAWLKRRKRAGFVPALAVLLCPAAARLCRFLVAIIVCDADLFTGQ